MSEEFTDSNRHEPGGFRLDIIPFVEHKVENLARFVQISERSDQILMRAGFSHFFKGNELDTIIKLAAGMAMAAVGIFASVPAMAVAFPGSQFYVDGTKTGDKTATFVYTADMRDGMNPDTNYTGTANFISAVAFKIGGWTMSSITLTGTTAPDIWGAGFGASSAAGSGCQGTNATWACSSQVAPYSASTATTSTHGRSTSHLPKTYGRCHCL